MENKKEGSFLTRLSEFKKSLNFETKTEFANWLGTSINVLSMVETGHRKPSKNFIDLLVSKSGKAEEYWLYGVDGEEIIDYREDFKFMRRTIDEALEMNLITMEGMPTSKENEKIFKSLMDRAVQADLLHILIKKNRELKK